MPKIRATVTYVWEYEPHPVYYPEGSTPEQMAEIDRDGFTQHPDVVIEAADAKFSVTTEVVNA